MINPIRLVRDIFDDVTFSDIKLQPFANDHLIRLGNNNPGGVYSGLITATTNAFTGYYGLLTDQATKEAISEGLTITTNTTKVAVLDKLSKQRDLVAYKFGAQSPIYQQFFPHGLDEYHQARLDMLPNMLDRYVVAATAHLSTDHLPEVTAITTLVNSYKAARNAQLGLFSQTDTVRTDRREARKVLTRQLTTNLLTLAIDFLENPDRFDDYYDATQLPLTKGSEEEDDTMAELMCTVVDELTMAPLVGAKISVDTPTGPITAITDADGRCAIDVPGLEAPLTTVVKAEAAGHTPESRTVTLTPGTTRNEDFTLGA